MYADTLVENNSKMEDNVRKEDYIEIDIPYNLYQYLSSEHCDVQNMCRICLSMDNEVLYSLMPTEENSIINHMFMAFTNIQIFPNDGLPACICEPCQTQVVHCYDFKVKCEKSDCMLKSLLKGEFVAKEEVTDQNVTVKKEVKEPDIHENTTTNENSPMKENNNFNSEINKNIQVKDIEDIDVLEDLQYLEELDDFTSYNDTLCIAQNTQNREKEDNNTTSNSYLKEVPKKCKLGSKAARKDKKTFACLTCSKVFNKASTYHAHVKSKHPRIAHPYSCGQCRESFNSEHDLNIHSVIHTQGNKWNCNQCSKEFKSKTALRRHTYRHMESKRFACDACGKAFSELYALRRHARVHTGQLPDKKHACTVCDKRYSEPGLLAAHMSRHMGLRPCECSTCGKRFPSQRLLASHRLVHSDRKPYGCLYCEKRFRHESTLNIHHRTHTGEKPYVCSVCGKSFIQNSNLTLHMRTHTGERPYSCSMCDSKFSSSSSLKSHEGIHSGERPYICHHCDKRFTRKNLTAHMRQHMGQRPFPCSVCHKMYPNASRLREHQRIHTGEQPFDCTMCTQTFATKSQAIKHMKIHKKAKKKKSNNCGLVILQHVDSVTPVSVVENRAMINKEHGKLVRVNENVPIDVPHENEPKELTLNLVQEVPLEVTGELVLQDDSNMNPDLFVVDNSQNNFQTDNVCLDSNNLNIIDDNVNYAGDVNLVTVNEGEVSISTSNLEGTTVKLYQLDQSLVQIHSAAGQVTISKITSKMTANF